MKAVYARPQVELISFAPNNAIATEEPGWAGKMTSSVQLKRKLLTTRTQEDRMMKVNFRKLFSVLLVLALVVSMIPPVTAEGETVDVGSSAAFCEAMANGGNIRLTDSFTLEAKATVPAGVTATLDLNGKTITSNDGTANYIDNKGTLTITDSSADNSGGITVEQTSTKNTSNVQCINNDGTLTVAGGDWAAKMGVNS